MELAELVALANVRSGKKKRELAAEMGHSDETRLSKIATGRLKADARGRLKINIFDTRRLEGIELQSGILR